MTSDVYIICIRLSTNWKY